MTPSEKEDARKRAQGTCRKEKKRLSEFHYMRCPKCGMELSEPMMYRKHIVAALLPLTVLEETVKLCQESFKTGDFQVGCRY